VPRDAWWYAHAALAAADPDAPVLQKRYSSSTLRLPWLGEHPVAQRISHQGSGRRKATSQRPDLEIHRSCLQRRSGAHLVRAAFSVRTLCQAEERRDLPGAELGMCLPAELCLSRLRRGRDEDGQQQAHRPRPRRSPQRAQGLPFPRAGLLSGGWRRKVKCSFHVKNFSLTPSAEWA